MNREELIANVQTIVIVIMENRSFDNVLGFLRHPDGANRADGESRPIKPRERRHSRRSTPLAVFEIVMEPADPFQ